MGLPAVYTVPSGVRWMIQTILPGWANSTQIEVGEAPTTYEPYNLFIDSLYYPEPAAPTEVAANKFVKVGDVCTITMGKARYKLVKQNNWGRALNTWRLYQGDIVDDAGAVVHNLWVDSDGEGAIKEVGAADFIGGFHGDETYSSVDILINGKPIIVANDLDTTFETLDIFVTSKLYHCGTVVEAFDRVNHLSFANHVYTCSNKFTTLSPFTVYTAALALFNCYKQYQGVDKIFKFTDNYKRTLETVPQGTSVDGGIYNSAKLDTGTIYGDGFIITIKYLDEKLPEYGGIWTDFGTQNRIKLYLHTIAAQKTLSVNDIITSMFSVTIE